MVGDDDADIPPEVTAAALKLQSESESFADEFSGMGGLTNPAIAPSPKKEPHRPQIFKDIIDNHNQQQAIRDKADTMSQDEWRKLGRLREDMRESLRPGAENALKWNTDKGSN